MAQENDPVSLGQLMLLADEINKIRADLPAMIRKELADDGRVAAIIAASNAHHQELLRQIVEQLPPMVVQVVNAALDAASRPPPASAQQ